MLAIVKQLVKEDIIEKSKDEINEKYVAKTKELEDQLLEREQNKQKFEQELETIKLKLEKERKKMLFKLFGIKSSRYKGLMSLLSYNTRYILDLDMKIESLKKEILDNFSTVEDNNKKIEADYEKKQTLKSLGLSFKDAYDLLSRNGIPVVLDESDLKYYESDTIDFEEKKEEQEETGINLLKDYVLVHKTNFYPKNGRINSTKEVNKRIVRNFKLDRLGVSDVQFKRNTVHFSVNAEVSSHPYGNFENRKYAILIPFSDIPVKQLRCGLAVDTYIEGGLNLPESSIILCPEEEIEMIKMQNPLQLIIGYKGKSVTNYADAMVGHLGYKIEQCGMRNWGNSKSEEEYNSKVRKSGLNISMVEHEYSIEAAREKCLLRLDSFIIMIKKIITENIILNDNDINTVMSDSLVNFTMDIRIRDEVFNILDKELSQYGIVVPQYSSLKLYDDIFSRTYGENLRYNILSQAIKIVENNLSQEKSKGR